MHKSAPQCRSAEACRSLLTWTKDITAQARADIDLINERRLNSCSDEIEENIDCRLSYRRGWPILAPLPLRHEYDLQSYLFPDSGKHIGKIWSLLEGLKPRQTLICVVHRAPYQVTETRASSATIFAAISNPNVESRHVAVREIRKNLASQDIHVAIELIDEGAMFMKTYSILPSETLTIQHWKNLHDRVTDYLDDNIPWISIDVLHRGLDRSREKCPATVVITAQDAADSRWWGEILPQLRSLCHPSEVELVNGDGSSSAPELDRRQLTINDFSSNIRLGGNCGLADTSGRGSLGGAIRLGRDGQEIGVFALSSHMW